MDGYTVDITAYTGEGTEVFRYATGGFVTKPTDSPANTFYEGRLLNPGSLKIMMFADGKTMGQSQIGHGEVVLANGDGKLDDWFDYGFDGRSIVIRKWLAGVVVLTMGCSMEQPVSNGGGEISIRIKDTQIAFTAPLQSNKYAGTNTLPNGVEGTADIQGKPKPIALGEVHNATPVLVNTSKLIYQGHESALHAIPAVYDKGVALTVGTAYSTQAALEAAQPLPGTYDTWLAGGCFRLGSSPFGAVTCDLVEGATAADRTAAQVSKRIALRATPSISYVAQSFTDLDTLNSAVVGYYASSETTIGTALDEVLDGIGAWYGFDAGNNLNVGRLDAPSGTPVATLTTAEILDIQRLATQDEGRGLPVWKVNLNYDKNYTVQAADSLAGVASSAWVGTTLPSSAPWNSIAFGNGMFVAVAQDGVAASSPDGINWTQRSLPAGNVSWSVCYGTGLFVAVAANSTMAATSPDGITWTQRVLPGNPGWSAVAYGNGMFVAVATPGMAAASSPDGITWTVRSLPASGFWSSVTYGNGLFVAVSNGNNFCATSPDGITWTYRTMPASGYWSAVAYGNGLFVAVSLNTLAATSPDGITWTQRTVPTNVSWSSLAYGSGTFLAVANGTNIAIASIDGITWQQQALVNTQDRNTLAYGNGSFVILDKNANTGAIYRVTLDSLRLGYVINQYRTVNDFDASILVPHPGATELNLNSLMVYPADAQPEATRQLTLRKVRRDYLAVPLKRRALSSMPGCGKVLRIVYPRYGYNAGKLFIVIGYEQHLDSDDLTLYLWG
jgi:hypothetical protein